MFKLFLVSIVFFTASLDADVLNKKGRFFTSFGYNGSSYSNSDIHFKGKNYDYTLYDVKASDRQSPLGIVYLTDITIPQFNFHIGYLFADNQSVIFSIDHMKYVMDTPQIVKIQGTDHQGNKHSSKEDIELDNFIYLEHTDGLNYLNFAYNYYFNIYTSQNKEHGILAFVGGAAGVLIPRSNIKLYGHSDRKDEFKVAGYGLDIQGGIQFIIYNNYYLRLETKYGYINMPYISTSPDNDDVASQSFRFNQYNFTFGYMF